jgi:hypothetical protein
LQKKFGDRKQQICASNINIYCGEGQITIEKLQTNKQNSLYAMDSFNTSWPSPSGALEALSNDGLPMDMISDMQEAFEPLTRAR